MSSELANEAWCSASECPKGQIKCEDESNLFEKFVCCPGQPGDEKRACGATQKHGAPFCKSTPPDNTAPKPCADEQVIDDNSKACECEPGMYCLKGQKCSRQNPEKEDRACVPANEASCLALGLIYCGGSAPFSGAAVCCENGQTCHRDYDGFPKCMGSPSAPALKSGTQLMQPVSHPWGACGGGPLMGK